MPPITHAKVSGVADSPDTSLVRPSDWNADHVVVGVGLYSDYIHIREEQASGVHGGQFTQAAWRIRVLNVELDDTGNDAALAANQITLEAGTYRALITAPAFMVGLHKARLQNISDAATLLVGTSEITSSVAAYAGQVSFVRGRFTLAAQKVLEVQHRCTNTKAVDGFGYGSGFGVVEVFTEVELWKEA